MLHGGERGRLGDERHLRPDAGARRSRWPTSTPDLTAIGTELEVDVRGKPEPAHRGAAAVLSQSEVRGVRGQRSAVQQ